MRTVTYPVPGIEWLGILVRRVLAAVLFYSGVNSLYRLLACRNQAVVLIYHRILDSSDFTGGYVQPGMYVTKEVFGMQMEYLSRRYRIRPLWDVIQKVKTGEALDANTCVVTFDDGWRETYIHAFPILKRYSFPATVFLVANYIGTDRWFWQDRVCSLVEKFLAIKKASSQSLQKYPALERIGFFRVVSDERLPRAHKVEVIIDTLKSIDNAEIATAVWELEDILRINAGDGYAGRLMLNWDEVLAMSQSHITFGSHTNTHPLLTRVSKRVATSEIVKSREEIEKHLLEPCPAFCYPNGSYNEHVKQIVSENYTCAFTAEKGFVTAGDDLFSLKRIGIHNDITFTKALFACRLTNILP